MQALPQDSLVLHAEEKRLSLPQIAHSQKYKQVTMDAHSREMLSKDNTRKLSCLLNARVNVELNAS